MIEIDLLGTGNPIPDAHRAGPATLVRAGERTLLVDCGRGVLQRLAALRLQASDLDRLLITHLHSDHLTDLVDVIATRWLTSFEPDPLVVVGPPRTQQVVDAALALLASDVEYRMAHHQDLRWAPPVEVHELVEGTVLDDGEVRVDAAPTDHRPVNPSVAFRVDHDGASVVLAGDTVPCAALDQLCRGADALVHTVARADLLEAIPISRLQDIRGYHSSVEDAARTATRAGVGTLVLTHFVPDLVPGTEGIWAEQAAAHFDGRIVVGEDLSRIFVP